MQKKRAPRNKTLSLTTADVKKYSPQIIPYKEGMCLSAYNKIIQGDIFNAYRAIPDNSVDLLFLDPPYNLSKQFEKNHFSKKNTQKYTLWFKSWFELLLPKLKESATVYVCGDWYTSISIYSVLREYLHVRNRITWEREKGRGSKKNFKMSHEDIWYATKSNNFVFNVNSVKLKKRVIAPYKKDGHPKDWFQEDTEKFRLTYPSNFWNDISVPFWSMAENTDHPTQKPEKLLAKLILASSNSGQLVWDPFLGSGTTAVVAQKLGREYIGIELSRQYILWSLKRLDMARKTPQIQGYEQGVFWERNSQIKRK